MSAIILYGEDPTKQGPGTELEASNLADLLFLVNSFDYNLVDPEGDGLVWFNDYWSIDFGGYAYLNFVDGIMAIHHFLQYFGWQFGLKLVTYCPHDWKKDTPEVKRAFGYLCREGFSDKINWHFGITNKYEQWGWYDVKVIDGNPFDWVVNRGKI